MMLILYRKWSPTQRITTLQPLFNTHPPIPYHTPQKREHRQYNVKQRKTYHDPIRICKMSNLESISHKTMTRKCIAVFLFVFGNGIYVSIYIHERFRHACHKTRDRQRRSIVSGQVFFSLFPSLLILVAVVMSSANGLVGTGFVSQYRPQHFSLSLTSNRVITNYSPSVLDRQPSW